MSLFATVRHPPSCAATGGPPNPKPENLHPKTGSPPPVRRLLVLKAAEGREVVVQEGTNPEVSVQVVSEQGTNPVCLLPQQGYYLDMHPPGGTASPAATGATSARASSSGGGGGGAWGGGAGAAGLRCAWSPSGHFVALSARSDADDSLTVLVCSSVDAEIVSSVPVGEPCGMRGGGWGGWRWGGGDWE